jgi:BirA family biotin operon repressor/biotin-[acetyl-CoA-carboxylase] ligase
MAAGLAVLDALGALGLAGARLKWPNDVVTDRGKLAGILVESRSPGPGAPHFVVGIGINVRQDAFGAELLAERAVTSLALEGVDVSPTRALEELVGPLRARLEAARGAPERIAADYLTATGLAGASVVVRTSGEELVGVVTALGLRAGLELSTDAGFRSIELAHVHAVEAARL